MPDRPTRDRSAPISRLTRLSRWPLPPNEDSENFHAQRGVSPDLARRVDGTPLASLDLLSNEDLVAYGIAEPTVDDPWLPPGAANYDSEEPEEIQP